MKKNWRWAVFAAYLVLLIVTTCFHESWFDEAQAWLMARDVSFPQLWVHYLRYEGTPGLWQSILWVPARLGFSYAALHVVSCIVAGAAVAVLLWRAPFRAWITALLPFTYFLMYQYAVIARSYSLFPLLFLLTAVALPHARRRTFVFLLLLVLMAITTVHGALAASGIGAAYLIEFWIDRRNRSFYEIRRHIIAGVVFALCLAGLTAQLWPPGDLSFIHVSSQTLTLGKGSVVAAAQQLQDAFSSRPEVAARWWFLKVFRLAPAGFVVAASAWWFHKNTTLWYFVLPLSAVLLLSALLYGNRWHAGVLFLIWLFAMWVTAERHRQPAPVYIWAVWIVVLAPQIYSSARSISYDVGNPYSGSKAVAKYLQSQDLPNRRVSASGYEAMSIQPYFTHNIFSNYHGGQNPAFWLWSTTNSFPQLMSSVPPDRPDLLVVALRTEEQRDAAAHLVRSLPQAGYVVGGWFSGQLYWKNSVLEPESFLVARRRDVAEIRER